MIECADGRTCPANTLCDDVHDACVLAEQLRTCVGINDGIACDIRGRLDGVCRDQVCLVAGCGDGFIAGSEDCDGALVPADRDDCTKNGFHNAGAVTCKTDCTLELSACVEKCGDGALNGDEACDDNGTSDPVDDVLPANTDCTNAGFYAADGLACSPACTLDVSACTQFCGDGIRNGSEECDGTQLGPHNTCDDLNYYSTTALTCTPLCRYDTASCGAYCGDGVVNGTEDCEPGVAFASNCTDFGYYAAAGLQCSAACTFDVSGCQQRCGDGVLDAVEDCDDNDTPLVTTDDVFGNITCAELGYYEKETLKCTAACGFDTSACSGFCGDRTLQSSNGEACEHAAPPGQSCLGFGYESGALDCSALCAPSLSQCHATGWTKLTLGSRRYADVWVGAADAVFAVGELGAIARFDGTQWSAMTSNVTVALNAVWGAAANDVFAVGQGGTILRWNGTDWQPMTSNTANDLLGVWGFASNDVYAVGFQGTVLHWDGFAWTPVAIPNLQSTDWFYNIVGVGPASNRALFLVGANGTAPTSGSVTLVWRFVNGNWGRSTISTSSLGATATSVTATAHSDAYVGTDAGEVYHWNDVNWTRVWGPTQSSLTDGWASSDRDVYFTANDGSVIHFDGVSWQAAATGAGSGLAGIWGSNPGTIVAVGQDMHHYDGAAWETSVIAPAGDAVWASSASNVFAVGGANIYHFNGLRWEYANLFYQGINFGAVWGAGPDDVYVGDVGKIAHLKSRAPWEWEYVTPAPTAQRINGMWGASATDIFAVGAAGTIVRGHSIDGTNWAPMTSNTGVELFDVWGTSASNVYAVGANQTILRWNGLAWAPVVTGISGTSTLQAIWGSGPSDIYVVGRGGTALHYNGTTWTAIPQLATLGDLQAVNGTGPGDVIVGGNNVIRHYDGLAWSAMRTPSLSTINAITFADPSNAFAAATAPGNGSVLRRSRACLSSERMCVDGRDDDCDGRYDCGDPDCSTATQCENGGLCAAPATLSCGDPPVVSTTAGRPNLITRYACAATTAFGGERSYTFQAPQTQSYTVSLTGQTADLDLFVLASTPGGQCEPRATGCLGASSSPIARADEAVTFAAQAGQTYYIVVDGYTASAGSFTLTLTCP